MNIDAWHGVRQLAKMHKPMPRVAVKTPDTDMDEPGALVSPFVPNEPMIETSIEEKISYLKSQRLIVVADAPVTVETAADASAATERAVQE